MTVEKTLDCPTCGVAMDKREEHDVTIDYCSDCGGVWLDPGELAAVTGTSRHGHHDSHHGSHHRDIDVDLDDDEEYEDAEYEDAEYEEAEYEEEDDGGLLGFVADAISGGDDEEWEEEGEWEEEEDWGGEEEF